MKTNDSNNIRPFLSCTKTIIIIIKPKHPQWCWQPTPSVEPMQPSPTFTYTITCWLRHYGPTVIVIWHNCHVAHVQCGVVWSAWQWSVLEAGHASLVVTVATVQLTTTIPGIPAPSNMSLWLTASLFHCAFQVNLHILFHWYLHLELLTP